MRLTSPTGDEVLEEIDASSSEQNGESVALPVEEEPTAYALEVRGKENAENFYLLRLDRPQGGDGEGDGEPPEEPEEGEEKPPEDPKDEDDQPPEEKKEPEPEPEPQTPLEDRLDKLDHNPKNLEALQKALQSRRGPPEKDW